ncbi:hypothetical protein HY523_02070 [Candidatus Berkelbacteria bacterium]|nr:hypothetical protein [Candidatus Berkelbacteria bacterium]
MPTNLRLTKQIVAEQALVVIPLTEWQEIQDALNEAASPKLRRSVGEGRRAYAAGKAVPYQHVRRDLDLE